LFYLETNRARKKLCTKLLKVFRRSDWLVEPFSAAAILLGWE
jgi:hypothetical protein